MNNLLMTFETPIIEDWIDYNGHLRDAFYFLLFSYATDALMENIGLDEKSRAISGHTLYTLEAHINYLFQAKLDDVVQVRTQLIDRDYKRLHIVHHLYRPGTSQLLAASEQLLMNIDQRVGRSAPFTAQSDQRVSDMYNLHHGLARPQWCSRKIEIRK
ncbi:thioesterase family protein [Pseudomonas sp. MPC6]|uniref:thioesterase family protein n=1 Tax=unclassified Pseudomonas TaxID=196821 RepID=UPI00111024E1|nr:thioesterase family protein [Pseudomonas sp. MPC6]QCY09402.1 thioesterase [Pseudomonas sp. MPC6]